MRFEPRSLAPTEPLHGSATKRFERSLARKRRGLVSRPRWPPRSHFRLAPLATSEARPNRERRRSSASAKNFGSPRPESSDLTDNAQEEQTKRLPPLTAESRGCDAFARPRPPSAPPARAPRPRKRCTLPPALAQAV